jgi:hypothetical protein
MYLLQWLAALHNILRAAALSVFLSRTVANCNKWAADFFPLNIPLKRPPRGLILPKQEGIQKAKGYSGGGHSTELQCTVHCCPDYASDISYDKVSFNMSKTKAFHNEILWGEKVWTYRNAHIYNDLNIYTCATLKSFIVSC